MRRIGGVLIVLLCCGLALAGPRGGSSSSPSRSSSSSGSSFKSSSGSSFKSSSGSSFKSSTPTRTYSAGPSKSSTPAPSFTHKQAEPPKKSLGSDITRAAQSAASKQKYEKAKSEGISPAGPAPNRTAAAPPEARIRPEAPAPKAPEPTRETRAQTVYGPAYGGAPPVVIHHHSEYGSGLSPWFWMWLMDRASAQERAEWTYHHRDRLSSEELRTLEAKDADLNRRVRALEGTPVQEKYTPATFHGNEDLMYAKPSMWRFWVVLGSLLLLLAVLVGIFWYVTYLRESPARIRLQGRKSRNPAPEQPEKLVSERLQYNPVRLLGGKSAAVGDTLTLRDVPMPESWTIKDIREWRVSVPDGKGPILRFAEYALEHDGQECWLWAVPDPSEEFRTYGYRPLVLTFDDELDYDQGFEAVLRNGSGLFVVSSSDGDGSSGGNTEETFRRRGATWNEDRLETLPTSLFAEVAGQVPDLICRWEYWDFTRPEHDDGGDFEEWMIVQMDRDDGRFLLRRGFEIAPEQIS